MAGWLTGVGLLNHQGLTSRAIPFDAFPLIYARGLPMRAVAMQTETVRHTGVGAVDTRLVGHLEV